MNSHQSKSFGQLNKTAPEGNLFSSHRDIRETYKPKEEPNIEFSVIWKKIWMSLKKLFVALKYQLYKATGGALEDIKLPWTKIAVVVLVGYLLFKKDFNFTVNMNAPSAVLPVTEDEDNDADIAQMGIAQAVAQHKKMKNPFADASTDNAKERKEKKYIRRFQKTAREEMKRFKIPASIKMAQGLLESGAGSSTLAQKNKNHFGIKCFSKKCGKGHCSNHSDDHHKDFFVNYKSDWDSWRAHSKLLSSKHYKSLKEHGTDYEAWAYGLKKHGYATDPRYPEKLINKIKKYKLYLLDK